jgi:AraC-like DNA-binding protein
LGQHPEGYSFTWERGRVLSAFQLVAISQGSGYLEFQQSKRKIGPGSVILLPPGCWHRYRPNPATGWIEDWIGLTGPTVEAWMKNGILDAGVVQMSKESAFWKSFQALHSVCLGHRQGFRAVAAGLAMTLLASVIAESEDAVSRQSDVSDIIRQARALLLAGHDVVTVAQKLGISYLSLYRHFKKATGLAPKEYAREIRIARAEDLISRTQLGIKEIAEHLGYYSASHLSLEFKKSKGLSPLHWRGRRTDVKKRLSQ